MNTFLKECWSITGWWGPPEEWTNYICWARSLDIQSLIHKVSYRIHYIHRLSGSFVRCIVMKSLYFISKGLKLSSKRSRKCTESQKRPIRARACKAHFHPCSAFSGILSVIILPWNGKRGIKNKILRVEWKIWGKILHREQRRGWNGRERGDRLSINWFIFYYGHACRVHIANRAVKRYP